MYFLLIGRYVRGQRRFQIDLFLFVLGIHYRAIRSFMLKSRKSHKNQANHRNHFFQTEILRYLSNPISIYSVFSHTFCNTTFWSLFVFYMKMLWFAFPVQHVLIFKYSISVKRHTYLMPRWYLFMIDVRPHKALNTEYD